MDKLPCMHAAMFQLYIMIVNPLPVMIFLATTPPPIPLTPLTCERVAGGSSVMYPVQCPEM